MSRQADIKQIITDNMSYAIQIARQYLKNDSEIEDAVQEAFIKCWKSIHQYNPQTAKFSTWFYSIVKNECLDRLRKQKRVGEYDITTNDLDTPDKLLERKEIGRKILDFAEALPETQQEVFLLREIKGMKIDEVCRHTQLSVGSVKTNLYLARKSIREKLLNLYHEIPKNI